MNPNLSIIFIIASCALLSFLRDPRVSYLGLELVFASLCLLFLLFSFRKRQQSEIGIASAAGVLILILESIWQGFGGARKGVDFIVVALLYLSRILPSPFWATTWGYLSILGVLIGILLGIIRWKGFGITRPGIVVGVLITIVFLGTMSEPFDSTELMFNFGEFETLLVSLITIVLIVGKQSSSVEMLLLAVAFQPFWIDKFIFPGLSHTHPSEFAGSEMGLGLYLTIISYLPILLFLVVIPIGSLLINDSKRERWILIASALAIALAVLARVWFTPYLSSVSYIENPSAVPVVKYFREPSLVAFVKSLYALWLWLPVLFMKFLKNREDGFVHPSTSSIGNQSDSAKLPETPRSGQSKLSP